MERVMLFRNPLNKTGYGAFADSVFALDEDGNRLG